MKILLLNLLMNVATGATDVREVEDYNWILDELNNEMVTLSVAVELDEKVKIFDKAGNLISEILKTDFDENKLENAQYKLLTKSAHMFDYLGDSYFLLED